MPIKHLARPWISQRCQPSIHGGIFSLMGRVRPAYPPLRYTNKGGQVFQHFENVLYFFKTIYILHTAAL